MKHHKRFVLAAGGLWRNARSVPHEAAVMKSEIWFEAAMLGLIPVAAALAGVSGETRNGAGTALVEQDQRSESQRASEAHTCLRTALDAQGSDAGRR